HSSPALRGDPYLNEFPWKFSNVSSDSLIPVAILAAVNFLGAWWLYSQLWTGLMPYALYPLIAVLTTYGTLFVGIPIVRYLILQVLNRGIETRNAQRQEYAAILANPSPELTSKLRQAESYQIKERAIAKDQVVYTTEKDVLEQEFEN